MTLTATGELVAAARDRGSAVGAFNVVTLEHAEAIVAAAESINHPVVLQLSENAVRFHGGQLTPIAAACRAVAAVAGVPVAVHLDHVTAEPLAAAALDAGFSSLMFDAGALPYAENVETTQREATRARAAGLWIEAELGYVGGKPGAVRSAHAAGVRALACRTGPEASIRPHRGTQPVDMLACE